MGEETGQLSRFLHGYGFDAPDEGEPTDRRVRRTRRALQEAFVSLVLERGYDEVTIDDITERADVSRGTFYSHYEDKAALLTAVFRRLISELASRVAIRIQSVAEVRGEGLEELYRHADEFRDFYRVCLSGAGDGRARDALMDLLTAGARSRFSERLSRLGNEPRVPLLVMARTWAGAQIALLRSWVEGEIDIPREKLASMAFDLLVAGFGWAHGLSPDQLQLSSQRDGEKESP